ncbi:hypothetical protein [Peribacillus sp. TH14]|uniref:hypothetical protein n=1 Tax=Peribacillus sp. TH14 TaxID=2798481 RepID=UPI001F5B194E|nr:hypothetical protein [Peribacillus sp. TH14]
MFYFTSRAGYINKTVEYSSLTRLQVEIDKHVLRGFVMNIKQLDHLVLTVKDIE